MPWQAWVIVAYVILDFIVTILSSGKRIEVTPGLVMVSFVTHVFLVYCVMTIV
jgi:hypothetical protein